MESYIIEEQDGLLVFTINREEKRNAISYDVMDGLEKAVSLAKENEIKAMMITGAGESAFCSGGDLSVFHQLRTADEAYVMLKRMSDILIKILLLPKPTIAVMNGTAVGGGCELASACDFRIAKNGMRAGFIQGSLAITTGWGGGTIISEKLTHADAMKMLMEAIPYNDEQLLQLGFVHSIYSGDAITAGQSYLHNIMKLESDVLKAYKEMFIKKMIHNGIEERVNEEVNRCAILWGEEAHHEQVAKFLNK
ncbi:enoyl-CoA hydratase/isomerase family protein [Cytobacillus purgationiresistens]|uniref:Ethylmalonyl-CoA decarboxylase n=1 Tax=Cytobacillus purgationiresistens TaxID=863449 RepID=A0ABU0AM93_9BACI|nr:enoyl-CoA hydratase/isomerase family protein [Cytobacillus purgationiresistens]MDQ0272382.1 enoyl-CoA hydratase/carnithine racemase [Cytobacillus purgationiresistens]